MKGSLIIVGFFVLGTICGVCHLLPFDIAETNISYYALCALMFSVGLSVGNDPQTLKNFRSLNPRLVFLPIMTILGTLAGSAAVSLILTHLFPAGDMPQSAFQQGQAPLLRPCPLPYRRKCRYIPVSCLSAHPISH